MASSFPSCLLVEVPEAERLVHELRLRWDPVAEHGVPAHVTAIFPFVARDDLDETVLGRVATVAAAHEPFDVVFSLTAWFERVALYLAPDDPAPFVDLTEALVREFPEQPPYEGAYDAITPHLTVVRWDDATDFAAIETELQQGLPVAGRAEQLTLMTEDDDGRWTVLSRLPFGD
jgi:2'-5' RNA ligase